MEGVTLKLDLDGDLRRLRFSGDPSYVTLRRRFAELYALNPDAADRAVLKYRDEDGDLITLASDDDLREAIALAAGEVLRLSVHFPAVGEPRPGAAADRGDAAASRRPAPDIRQEPAAADRSEPRPPRFGPARAVFDHSTARAFAGYGHPGYGPQGRAANEWAAHAAEEAAAAAGQAADAAQQSAQQAAGAYGQHQFQFPMFPPHFHGQDTGATASGTAGPAPPYPDSHPNPSGTAAYPQDPSPNVTTGIPEVDGFINALGGLERFLPSFLAMMGVPGANVTPMGGVATNVGAGGADGAGPGRSAGASGGASAGAGGAGSGGPFQPSHPGMGHPPHTPFGSMFGPPPPPFGQAHPHPPPPPPFFGPPPHPHHRAHAFYRNTPHGGPGMGPGRGPYRRGGRHASAEAHAGVGPFGPFAAAMTGNMAQCFQNISAETRAAFRELIRAVTASGSHLAALAALRAAFPAARDWLQRQVGENGPLSENVINSLIESITPIISPHLGEELTGRLTGFLRIALVDNAVVQLLRGLDAGNLPESMDIDIDIDLGSFFDDRMRAEQGPASFDVHVGIECDGCGSGPIIGSRFKCEACPNYDLCPSCKMEGVHGDTEHTFKEFKYPWEASNDAVVPPAPLGFRDRSPHVAHLQKILTELGYMNDVMYSRRVGFFGPNTRAALAQFQREYGLEQNVVLGMYDDLTRGALFSIVDSGSGRPAADTPGGDEGAGSAAAPPAQEASA